MAIRKVKTKSQGWRYQARVHLGGGKYRVIGTFAAKGVARQEEAKWIAERGERKEVRRMTGQEFADFYLPGYAQRVKSSTLHHAEAGIRCWLKTFATRTLRSIDPTEAEEWVRLNGWASYPVVTMLNYAVRKEVLNRNPFSGLTRKGPGRKNKDPLSVEEVGRLADIAGELHGPAMRAFILTMAYTAMRNCELYALRWDNIDFNRGRVLVSERLYRGTLDLPKSNKPREIALLPEARAALMPLDKSTDWVFLSKRGKRLSAGTLAYYWQGVRGAFGKPVDAYDLRHFCGHFLYVTKGIEDRIVAAQLGHNDGGRLVRELYGHGDFKALDELDRLYDGGEQSNVVPLRAVGE